MRYQARITASDPRASLWAQAIAPEAQTEGSDTQVNVTHTDHDLTVTIGADESRLLRATLNSQLRWLATAAAVTSGSTNDEPVRT